MHLHDPTSKEPAAILALTLAASLQSSARRGITATVHGAAPFTVQLHADRRPITGVCGPFEGDAGVARLGAVRALGEGTIRRHDRSR